MKGRRVICIYTCMYCVLENCFPPTLFFCDVCGSIWLIQNNQGSILTRRRHRLETGNAGVGICSVKSVPLHCSSRLCFRCIILLLTYWRHSFVYVISKTSAFSKKEKNPRVGTERVDVQEIAKADVSNCALMDRCSFLNNVGNALVRECKKCWQM